MWIDLPDPLSPILTVELKDGRKVVGALRGFTAERTDNRELALTRPIAATAGPNFSGNKVAMDGAAPSRASRRG